MEWALIDQLLKQLHRPESPQALPLGPGHDSAILRPRAGHDLVVCHDVLNAGVHFPERTAPFDIGWKALAVNLSDLAASGARPRWMTLGLSLPAADPHWLEAFATGMRALLRTLPEDCHPNLIGGDTTRGPLSIAVQLLGEVPRGQGLSRTGARPGDGIWLTGPLGDAAAALHGLQQGLPVAEPLLAALNRPRPQLQAGLQLRAHASACIDISDGLLADLGHVLRASGCGATLELAALPESPLFTAFCQRFGLDSRPLQLAGGDDYQLCFTLPPAAEPTLSVLLAGCQRIGRIESEPGLRLCHDNGRLEKPNPERPGYQHFA